MNGKTFLAYVAQVPAPALPAGGIMIMDKKPACRPTSQPPCVQRSKQMAQRRASCRQTVRAFNPVRKAFAKLKAVLPKAATRTTKELWTAIADALAVFTPQECENYCVACGHEPD